MSWFVCIGTAEDAEAVVEAFGEAVAVEEFTETPLGRAALGGAPGRAYLLTNGMHSHELLGRGHPRSSCPEAFVAGVERLLERSPGVGVVVHLATGWLPTETVTPRGERELSVDRLRELYPALEEDVRYVVRASESR